MDVSHVECNKFTKLLYLQYAAYVIFRTVFEYFVILLQKLELAYKFHRMQNVSLL